MEDGKLARWPMVAITVLRVIVGWHFLYEGIAKLTSASWSAAGYMKQARGPFADLFKEFMGPMPAGPAVRPAAPRPASIGGGKASTTQEGKP